MWIFIAFIGGISLGVILTVTIARYHSVGALVLDFTDPMNDQPFLLELNRDVNMVYKKKWICLKVRQKYSDFYGNYKSS